MRESDLRRPAGTGPVIADCARAVSARSAAARRSPRSVKRSCAHLLPVGLRRALGTVVAIVALAVASGAPAQSLRIGLAADVTSIDPHYINLIPNNNIAEHIFDKLVRMDADSRLVPGLATSWKPIGATTWEFRLRKGVKFHDGSDLTAADVAFSIDRVARIENSPGPFVAYTKAITAIDIVDPTTIRFRTASPHPLMPNDLSTIYIVSRKVASGASTEDFNTGRATVGSGPYRFVRYVNGDRIELVRNDGWWGGKAPFSGVTFRILKNDAARVAAILSGDVDAIEQPPIADLTRLSADPRFVVVSKISHRVIFFNFNHLERSSPFVTDRDGRQLARNPFRDLRVRRAMSKAVNRTAMVERVMEGHASPSGQLVSANLFGHVPGLEADAFDPEGAKRLLAEAGYPDGFQLTIHAPAGRYVNDEKIAQAAAQMLTRVGIVSKVETLPMAPYSARASRQEFSFHLLGWGASTGEASSPLRSLLATFDRDKETGAVNWGRYSNPALDLLIAEAVGEVDDGRRRGLLEQATRLAMADVALMPLHFQFAIWATRKGIAYAPRTDEYTLAFQFRAT